MNRIFLLIKSLAQSEASGVLMNNLRALEDTGAAEFLSECVQNVMRGELVCAMTEKEQVVFFLEFCKILSEEYTIVLKELFGE